MVLLDRVVTIAAGIDIDVVALAAVEEIITLSPDQHILVTGASQRIVPGRACLCCGAGDLEMVPHGIGEFEALDPVYSRSELIHDGQEFARRIDRHEHIRAGARDRHITAGQPGELNRINIAPTAELADRVIAVARPPDIDVVAGAAAQSVVAGAAFENIVTCRAMQRLAAVITRYQIESHACCLGDLRAQPGLAVAEDDLLDAAPVGAELIDEGDRRAVMSNGQDNVLRTR